MRIAQEARTISRYGLRGSQASNPGPLHLRRLRRASQSRIGQSPVSDGELLVRANMGWDVLPRVGGEGCSIVSPTDSPAPNVDAIQQTLVDTDQLSLHQKM